MTIAEEAEALSTAYIHLEETRAKLIAIAKRTAIEIALRHGTVTSTLVLTELEADPKTAAAVRSVDARFMGCVFRDRRVWRHIGWTPTGSHTRHVSIWEYLGPRVAVRTPRKVASDGSL